MATNGRSPHYDPTRHLPVTRFIYSRACQPKMKPSSHVDKKRVLQVPAVATIMPTLRGCRPVRSAKQVQPAPGYIDSSTLLFDSEDEGTESEGECEDEDRHTAKKLRLSGKFKAQAKASPLPPDSSCLAYYPETYAAVQAWNKMLDLPSSHPMSDAPVTNLPTCDVDAPEPPPAKALLSPGVINKNEFYDETKAGFESLPGEIRSRCFPELRTNSITALPSALAATKPELLINELYKIYALVFKKRAPIDFTDRSGFARSSAFLRVNRVVYDEARMFVYSENRFCFGHNFARSGYYFEPQWKELAWTHVRRFLTDIGPENTGLIKNLGINFCDASPSGNPYATMDQRRFTYNKDVLWILNHLSQHGKILKLKLGFCGRRNVRMLTRDGDFLNALKGVKTDELEIGDPKLEVASSFDDAYHSKVDGLAQKMLKAVMIRPLPLKDLDPRLKF